MVLCPTFAPEMERAFGESKYEHFILQWQKCFITALCLFWMATARAQPGHDVPETALQDVLARTREIAALPSRVFAAPVAAAASGIKPGEILQHLKLAEQMLDNDPPALCLSLLHQLEPFVQTGEDLRFRFLYLQVLALVRQEETDHALSVCAQLGALAGDDPGRIGWVALAEARIRHAQLQFHTTYRLAGSALDFARKSDDKQLEMRALSVVGKVSRDIYMTMPERSAPYHEQALEIARSLQ